MERSPSLIAFGGNDNAPRLRMHRLAVAFAKLYGWFLDKGKQIRAFSSDKNLLSAVFSGENIPVEGPRYKVGSCINVYRADGELRRLKICGIQSGGFSNVYIVIDLDEMRPYCLKENRALPGDEFTKNRKLAIEADISLRLLPHPNLVTSHEAFYLRSRLAILTEYLPSPSLNVNIKTGPLALETALKNGIQICRAMRYAQAMLPGLVHGDIKPANCFSVSEGTLKLGDFGLASFRGSDEKKNRWGGTAAYMAPEMHDNEQPRRDRADIYALGVTLFEMLSGERPYVASSRSDLVELHRSKEFDRSALDVLSVPAPVVDLIDSCLAKAPEKRPSSFEMIESVLTSSLKDLCGQVVPVAEAEPLSNSEAVRRALSFGDLGNIEEASALLDAAIEANGPSPELLSCKAIVLAATRPDEAYTASTSALMMRADIFVVLLAHSRVLAARGDLENAAAYLRRALQIRPDNCVALNFMGRLLELSEMMSEAASFYYRSLSIDRSQTEPLQRLAGISLSFRQTVKAVKFAESAVAADPLSSSAHCVLGLAHQAAGRRIDALVAFKNSLRFAVSPSRETAKLFLREALDLCCSEESTNRSQLVKTLISSTKVFGGSRAVSEKADFTRRFTGLLRGTHLDPVWFFWFDDAIIKAVNDMDPEPFANFSFEILKNIRRFVGHELPKHVLNSFGRISYQLGEYSDCQLIYRQILDRFGGDANASYYLAACFEMQQEFEKALKYYRKANRLEASEDARTGTMRCTAELGGKRNARERAETLK